VLPSGVAVRVLLVQPREALARTTARQLQGAGFEPIVVADGDAAIRLAVTDPPSVVLLDLTLPAIDGWCVLSTLGSRSGPPVVVYTAPGDSARAVLLGAAACLHDRGGIVPALRRVLTPVPT
jgi:DNA-binding response OmpR family regulator